MVKLTYPRSTSRGHIEFHIEYHYTTDPLKGFAHQNDINFFIPPVGDLPEIEECLYLTTTMECNSFHI